jgi:BASS family bile acid:Na+ symporter
LDDVITVFLPFSLILIMFSLGIGLTVEDFARVMRQPRAFFTGALLQLIAVPAVAALGITLVEEPAEIAFGVMLVALCPGGVSSNMMTRMAGGNVALSVSLTGVVSLITVITVPILANLSGRWLLGDSVEVDVAGLTLAILVITTIPVLAGVGVRRFVPGLARRLDAPLYVVSSLLFMAIVALGIVTNRELLAEEAARLGPLLIGVQASLFALALSAGWVLRLPLKDRISISLEAGVQNAGLAIALAALIAGQATTPISFAPGVYGVLMYLVAAPFMVWGRRAVGRAALGAEG